MKKILYTLAPALFLLASCKTSNIKEPEYREIRDVKIKDVGLLKTTAGLDIVYYNPNSFGVQINDAIGDVYVDNIHLGRFDLDEKVEVRKRREFVVPALIKINNLSALANHRDIWNKKQARIRIEGKARVKKSGFSVEVPIKYEGMQDIEKLKELFPLNQHKD
jgi:LEA14-like dessication related protein